MLQDAILITFWIFALGSWPPDDRVKRWSYRKLPKNHKSKSSFWYPNGGGYFPYITWWSICCCKKALLCRKPCSLTGNNNMFGIKYSLQVVSVIRKVDWNYELSPYWYWILFYYYIMGKKENSLFSFIFALYHFVFIKTIIYRLFCIEYTFEKCRQLSLVLSKNHRCIHYFYFNRLSMQEQYHNLTNCAV